MEVIKLKVEGISLNILHSHCSLRTNSAFPIVARGETNKEIFTALFFSLSIRLVGEKSKEQIKRDLVRDI